MDFNDYLALKLVEARLAEARVAAERARLLASAPAENVRRRAGLRSLLVAARRWLAGATWPAPRSPRAGGRAASEGGKLAHEAPRIGA